MPFDLGPALVFDVLANLLLEPEQSDEQTFHLRSRDTIAPSESAFELLRAEIYQELSLPACFGSCRF